MSEHEYSFPPLEIDSWKQTRDTLQQYSDILSRIRQSLTPKEKHWFHVSLRTSAEGLTTTPIPYGDIIFQLTLDFGRHDLIVVTSTGERKLIGLHGQSINDLCEELLMTLSGYSIDPPVDFDNCRYDTPLVYEQNKVYGFWKALSQIDALLKRFKAELREETGPVNLWPHHFDLAVLWFSGRRVPGKEQEDPENADEQMNFGFVTGDESINEPYFYVTAYPQPDGFTDIELPGAAYWFTDGFTAAVLPYSALVNVAKPDQLLMEYLRTVHQAGKALMLEQ